MPKRRHHDDVPQTVPELQKLVAELQDYIARRRAQKTLSMARWRERKRKPTVAQSQTITERENAGGQ